jgi:hypothetical protein
MPTIHENQFFTVLVEFEVDPSQQYTFINEIAEQVEQHFKSMLGSFLQVFMRAMTDSGLLTTLNGNQKKPGRTHFTRLIVTKSRPLLTS